MNLFNLSFLVTIGSVTIAQIVIPPNFTILENTTSTSGSASCARGSIQAEVTATNQRFNLQPPANQFEATELIQELLQRNSPVNETTSDGTATVSGSFSIAAVLCYPQQPQQTVRTVQILSHGGGLDRSYWDITANNSYVDAAAQAGYATFAYDRLGAGDSDHPDPIQTVQAAIEVEVLHSLITSLRATTSNIVCVGHSLGSVVQLGLNRAYPSDCSAVVTTGLSDTLEYVAQSTLSNNPAIANTVNGDRFGDLSNGYLIDPTRISFQQAFFRYPFFDTAVFEAQFERAATYGIGELLTLPTIFNTATQYTGPVDVVLGQFDFPCCLGDCREPIDRTSAFRSNFYPSARSSSTFIVPNTGHCINDHQNARQAYDHINAFLGTQGL